MEAVTGNMKRKAYLTFTVETWRLALPLEDVRRVIPLPILQAPLGAPRFIEGIFDFRGEPVAAIRLDRVFGLEEKKLGVYSPLLVLDATGLAVALHVDRMDGILNLDETDVQSIGREETFNACIAGRFADPRGDTIFLLSKDELLLAEERAKIVELQAMRQRRLDELEGAPIHAS